MTLTDENGEQGWTDQRICHAYLVSPRTVERTRKRFVTDSFSIAVHGKKRKVFKEKILDGEVEDRLIALRRSDPPSGYAEWTLELLADRMVKLDYVEHISRESVRKILKKNRLKPWRVKPWIIPEAGPDFVCAMKEVLDAYTRSYDPSHPVVCPDESPRWLIGEKRKAFTDKDGTVREDYEYVRNGAADIFMMTEPLGGRREIFVRDRHTRLEWAEIAAYTVESIFPGAEKNYLGSG